MQKISIRIVVLITVVLVAVISVFIFVNTRTKDYQFEKYQETEVVEQLKINHQILGQSSEKRNIESFTYGNGYNHLLFVGGIHGEYEYNSVLLAREFIKYFESNTESIPNSIKVTIIPNLNPDGLVDEKYNDVGRFNANDVDLNRNFDCKWKPESTWRNQKVSAGTEPFSEPESKLLRDFVLENSPKAVVFWHSQSNAVYASECENGILPATRNIMNIYSQASGYPAVDVFDAYDITGDAEGWLASIDIPAITVELSNHKEIEWDNLNS